jgi:uncharacterized protein YabN with tetrapyrrole methylase and pyrophosphatase domain
MGRKTRELEEQQVEVKAGDQDKIEAEFGDVLFSMISISILKHKSGCFGTHQQNLSNVFST